MLTLSYSYLFYVSEECCDRVTLQSTFTELNDPTQYYSQFLGEFSYSGVDHNSHKVYQSDRFSTACLFYSNSGNWIINACSDLDTTSRKDLKIELVYQYSNCTLDGLQPLEPSVHTSLQIGSSTHKLQAKMLKMILCLSPVQVLSKLEY